MSHSHCNNQFLDQFHQILETSNFEASFDGAQFQISSLDRPATSFSPAEVTLCWNGMASIQWFMGVGFLHDTGLRGVWQLEPHG